MTVASEHLTDDALLIELEPVVERELDRHLSMAKDWYPHEYVPWSQGEDFAGPLDGREWTPEDETLLGIDPYDEPARG